MRIRRGPFYKIKKFLNDRSNYQTGLFLLTILFTVPLCAVILVLSFFFIQRGTFATVQESQYAQLQEINEKIAYVLTDTQNMSQEIYYNDAVQEILKAVRDGEEYPSDTETAYFVNNFVADRDFVDSVVLTGMNSTVFSTERAFSNYSSFSSITHKWWYEELTGADASYYWFPMALEDNTQQGVYTTDVAQQDNEIVFARPIYNMDDLSEQLGYMFIYISPDYLEEIWSEIEWGKSGNVLIYDENNNLITSNDETADYSQALGKVNLDNESSIVHLGSQRYVVSSQTLGNDDWTICMITPLREVSRNMGTLAMEVLVMAAVAIVMLLLISRFHAKNMARPIHDLSSLMDAYQETEVKDKGARKTALVLPNDLSREKLENYQARADEVGSIYRSYEQLLERMHTLIQDNYIKDLEKKDAELALLQSQINPHFLYNTLDMVNWMALANDQTEISEMITALSDTFRLSLIRNNSQFCAVEQELQYIKSYLVLQQFRYGKRLVYEIEAPQPLPKLYIPRFILQPVVENALKHGIDLLEEGGRLKIALIVDEKVTFVVENDGNEIDLNKMNRILDFHPDKTELLSFKPEGYGVQNINRRIKILCGLQYGLTYEKTQEKTICKIILPKRENDDTN
ncbi:cache domain-containing sensor histidine kinase [Eubacterium oxidoreducens]|uniref:Two-component system, sensor histidine kinase YesM n=1 Tax=Eubacterium oxidoreducens TaxID=1732 RepID=A0A1G6AEW6_EUBOX|nr:sensor histidine kinase [Eubacterium oxidoreducens]SDB06623.1 two-component system, sensor histidine kinase YesM [Eubacterium oxidoreducens]